MKLPACSSRCTGHRARRSSSTRCGSAWYCGLSGVSWKSPGIGCSAILSFVRLPARPVLLYRFRQLVERLFEPGEAFGHAGHDRLGVRAWARLLGVTVVARPPPSAVRLFAHRRIGVAQPPARVALL